MVSKGRPEFQPRAHGDLDEYVGLGFNHESYKRFMYDNLSAR